MSRPAVFLDRDGTLNREVDYLADPAAFELLPGVGEALQRLSRAGFALVVITNQSGVARGLLDEATLARIHKKMEQDLAAFHVDLDGIEWCPHHPDFGSEPCSCRKPEPGMIVRAAERLDLDLAASWTVGDALRDLEAGRAAGTRALLVRTGKGRAVEPSAPPGTQVVDDLAAAAGVILD